MIQKKIIDIINSFKTKCDAIQLKLDNIEKRLAQIEDEVKVKKENK